MSVNKVILLGNLGRDPEVRYLDNNKVVATFTLATSETFTNKNGERQTETEWHNVEVWDNLARITEKYLKKGNQVYIEGKIKTEKWTDKEGIERTGKKIRALNITLVGNRSSQESVPQAGNQSSGAHPETPHSLEDDLPF